MPLTCLDRLSKKYIILYLSLIDVKLSGFVLKGKKYIFKKKNSMYNVHIFYYLYAFSETLVLELPLFFMSYLYINFINSLFLKSITKVKLWHDRIYSKKKAVLIKINAMIKRLNTNPQLMHAIVNNPFLCPNFIFNRERVKEKEE